MRLLILILVACSMLGCSAADHKQKVPTRKSSLVERSAVGFGSCEWKMRVRISTSSFSAAESHKIGQAMLNWNRASGGRICFIVEWVDMSQPYESRNWISDDATTLYAGHMPWHRQASTANICKKPNSCRAITIWPLSGCNADVFYFHRGAAYFRTVTEHELGHVLGLSHLPQPEALMYGKAPGGPDITEYDLKALRCLMDHGAVGNYHNPCRTDSAK